MSDISKWDVSSVTDMNKMFSSASSFNSDISKWDVSSVTNMKNMFYHAKFFRSDIWKWQDSRVTDTAGMFWSATSFNSDILTWDVSRATTMEYMFAFVKQFNSDISKWDVSSVTNMNHTFWNAASFNGDISKWDVSRVADMKGMFSDASSFKQTLCGAAWVDSKASKNFIFGGSSGSISRTVCATREYVSSVTPLIVVTSQYVSRRPIPERELILKTAGTVSVSTPVITSVIGSIMTCLKCGTFKKSGKVSCCAPGGSWFKTCGGSGNRNADHTWSEGMKACTRKFVANAM